MLDSQKGTEGATVTPCGTGPDQSLHRQKFTKAFRHSSSGGDVTQTVIPGRERGQADPERGSGASDVPVTNHHSSHPGTRAPPIIPKSNFLFFLLTFISRGLCTPHGTFGYIFRFTTLILSVLNPAYPPN